MTRSILNPAIGLVGMALWSVAGAEPAAATAPPVSRVGSSVVSDTAKVRLAIRGLTCGACAKTAQLALNRAEGVYHASVSYDSASAVVSYDPAKTTPERFIAHLERLTGYEARVVDEQARPEGQGRRSTVDDA